MEEEQHKNEDSVHTVAFALGTFVLMVCLKRFLVEQWRAWIFLLLNLILLAIFFMSTKKPRWSAQSQESENRIQQIKTHLKKESVLPPRSEESKECSSENNVSNKKEDEDEGEGEGEVEGEGEGEEEEEEEVVVAALSKEELNERVEAFIAMFRQHLISDVKQGFNFPQTANLTTQPNKIQVSCC